MTEVLMPEMMRRFECNQQGCCCSGWRIPFDGDELFTLLNLIPDEERADLLGEMEILLETGTNIIDKVRLKPVGEDASCRFLEEKRCGLQVKHGADVLPVICRAFPTHAQRGSEGLELHYDAVCPEVINQIAEDEAPFRLIKTTAEPGTDLGWRAMNVCNVPDVVIGERAFHPHELWVIRERILKSIEEESARGGRAVEVLSRINYAVSRLVSSGDEIGSFEIKSDDPLPPFEAYLDTCMQAHEGGVLYKVFRTYERFIFALDLTGRDMSTLEPVLSYQRDWRETLDWSTPEFQPLLLRYLGHRFFSAFDRLPEGRELGFNYGTVTHCFATLCRYAVGLSRWLERPIDQAILKVSLGATEYFYRSWSLIPSAMPWFGLALGGEERYISPLTLEAGSRVVIKSTNDRILRAMEESSEGEGG